jgi:hypothetical protein
MGTAREDDVKEDRARAVRGGGPTTRDLLQEAQGLAVQIEQLLTSPGCQTADSDTLRIRLARAHTLSLLDQLSELLEPISAKPGSSVRAPREEDVDTTSGIRRPATSWR